MILQYLLSSLNRNERSINSCPVCSGSLRDPTLVRGANHYNSQRSGYSLLELMLAMSLLAGLLAVGWNLLGTYRDAEQRGWKLAARTQTIRTARMWLEDDMAHLLVAPRKQARDSANSLSNVSPAVWDRPNQHAEIHFVGTSAGLSAMIAPSVDPLPFLERLISGSQMGLANSTTSSLHGPDDLPSAMSPKSFLLWPPDWLMIEYRIIPVSVGEPGDFGESDEVWSLVRREMIDRKLWLSLQPDNHRLEEQEPELTSADLYGRSESSGPIQQPIVLKESQLSGIGNPRFTYFDGAQWSASWNSSSTGHYPKAICLEFDLLDSPTSLQTQVMAEVDGEGMNDFEFWSFDRSDDLPTVELDFGSEAGVDAPFSSSRDVRIVVSLDSGGINSSGRADASLDLMGGVR